MSNHLEKKSAAYWGTTIRQKAVKQPNLAICFNLNFKSYFAQFNNFASISQKVSRLNGEFCMSLEPLESFTNFLS